MSGTRVCNCVHTIHIVISASIGINYALFVMIAKYNAISVYFDISVRFVTIIYYAISVCSVTELSKATNMIV